MNALTTARWGLTSAEHYYGLPEALFEDRVVQNFPLDYDYNDEYFRFSVSGQMFKQGAEPGSAKWNEVLERFLAARLHLRADLHDLRRQSRPDARAPGRLAQGIHLEVDVGLLHAAARRPRLLLVSLVDPERDRVEGELSPLDGVHQRVQEPRRPRLHRQRFGLHLPDLRLRLCPRARAAAGGGLPSARSHPLGHVAGRRPVRPAGRARHAGGRQAAPTCWCTTTTR